MVKLKAFSKFENTSEALEAAILLMESKPSEGLCKFLRANCGGKTLAVADLKLGNMIEEKLVCYLIDSIDFFFFFFLPCCFLN